METKRKTSLGWLAQPVLGLTVLFTGWGLDDLSDFFVHPARTGFVGVALLGVLAALAGRLDVQVFRKGKRPVGRQRWLLGGLFAISISLAFFLPYADRRSVLTLADADALRYAGLALYAAGSVLALAALRALGKQYSSYVTVQDDHKLVQTGIYSVIRHPIYLRALLVSVGLPLVFRSWLVAPLFLLILIFVAVRIRQEEKLLAEQFGTAFNAYRKCTWRLLPFIY